MPVIAGSLWAVGPSSTVYEDLTFAGVPFLRVGEAVWPCFDHRDSLNVPVVANVPQLEMVAV